MNVRDNRKAHRGSNLALHFLLLPLVGRAGPHVGWSRSLQSVASHHLHRAIPPPQGSRASRDECARSRPIDRGGCAGERLRVCPFGGCCSTRLPAGKHGVIGLAGGKARTPLPGRKHDRREHREVRRLQANLGAQSLSESGSAVIPRSWSGGAAKIGKARRGRYLSSQSSAPSFRRRHTLTDSICRVPSAKAKCAGVRLGALLSHRVRCANSALGAFARSATQTKTSLPPAAAPS